MRVIESAMLLALMLTSGVSLAAELSEETKPSIKWTPKAQAPIPADALSGMPDASAGCLVVGYHILKDGLVAKVRVMQGAYTRDVPEPAQQAFAEAALKAVAGWTFMAKRRDQGPVFGWTAVGFAPIDGLRRR